jgi:hypothetical protein
MGYWKDVFVDENVPAWSIEIGERHRKDLGDIDALAKSIDEVGLLQPLVVVDTGRKDGGGVAIYWLVAGHRRLQALMKLRREKKRENDNVPVRVARELTDAVELLRAERDENTCRKDFTPTEAVAIGRDLEGLEKAKAKERKSRPGRARADKLSAQDKGRVRDKVAGAVGMSGTNYAKAKRVVEAAEADPGRFGDLAEGMDKSGSVHQAHEEMKRRQRRNACSAAGLERMRELNAEGKTTDQIRRALMDEDFAVAERKFIKALEAIRKDPATASAAATVGERTKALGAATECLNLLRRIGQSNPSRARAFQIVTDWIRSNGGADDEAEDEGGAADDRRAERAWKKKLARNAVGGRREMIALVRECIDILKKPEVGRQTTLALDHLWKVEQTLLHQAAEEG